MSYPVELVERALDDARRRGTSLRWIRDTAERLHRPGASGPRILLGLLDALQPGAAPRDSWFEKLIEHIVSDPALPTIERQFELHESCGRHVDRFDLAIRRYGLELRPTAASFTSVEWRDPRRRP